MKHIPSIFIIISYLLSSDQIPAPSQDHPILIQGGTIHTISHGILENADILFENGIIKIENDNIEIKGPRNTFDKKGNFEVPKSIKSIKFSAKKDFDDSLVKSVIYFLNKYKNLKKLYLI